MRKKEKIGKDLCMLLAKLSDREKAKQRGRERERDIEAQREREGEKTGKDRSRLPAIYFTEKDIKIERETERDRKKERERYRERHSKRDEKEIIANFRRLVTQSLCGFGPCQLIFPLGFGSNTELQSHIPDPLDLDPNIQHVDCRHSSGSGSGYLV